MRSTAPAAAGGLAALSPSSFAFVMATGIVALAARQQGLLRLALGLFAAAAIGWGGLWLLTLLRLARHAGRVWQDARDHLRGPGYSPASPAPRCWPAAAWRSSWTSWPDWCLAHSPARCGCWSPTACLPH